jgi:hypothetical protein
LDDAPRIETVGERAGGDREQQKWQPVRDDRESGERRRMEFLEHHPVADDVLDIVGHHRKHEGDELDAESRMPHGGERAFRRRNGRSSVLGLNVQEGTFRGWRRQPDGCETRRGL